jgi:hypothetical protein
MTQGSIQGWYGYGIAGIQGYTGTHAPSAYEMFFDTIKKNSSLENKLQECGFKLWNHEFWNEIDKLPDDILPLFIGIHKNLDIKISEHLKHKKEVEGG